MINLPLDGADLIAVDFGLIYQQTFESRRLFSIVVDYAKAPVRFDTYIPKDQECICQKMAVIAGGAN